MESSPDFKFLTADVIKTAVVTVLDATVFNDMFQKTFLERKECHVVVMVPTVYIDLHGGGDLEPDPKHAELVSKILYQQSIGIPEEWEFPFDEIARNKALQLLQNRNYSRTDILPHLLVEGDAPYWGGTKREGLIVTCSGFQQCFDRMISEMIADMIIALCYHSFTLESFDS